MCCVPKALLLVSLRIPDSPLPLQSLLNYPFFSFLRPFAPSLFPSIAHPFFRSFVRSFFILSVFGEARKFNLLISRTGTRAVWENNDVEFSRGGRFQRCARVAPLSDRGGSLGACAVPCWWAVVGDGGRTSSARRRKSSRVKFPFWRKRGARSTWMAT